MILVINPGSTSTKVSIYQCDPSLQLYKEENIKYTSDLLAKYGEIKDQLPLRLKDVSDFIASADLQAGDIKVIMCRGGLVKPIEGGTYQVDEDIIADLKAAKYGQHASNLGALIGHELAKTMHINTYIVDPPVVDEMSEIAKVTGIKDIRRKSVFHALNQRKIYRDYVAATKGHDGRPNLIIAHLGGGITVALHEGGRVVDVNNGLGGNGAFSPERAGTITPWDVATLMEQYRDQPEVMWSKIIGRGGMVDLLGTNSIYDIANQVEAGDEKAKLYLDAMCYQISKEIGSLATALCGQIDGIILTGGIAHNEYVTKQIIKHVEFIAPVTIMPGELEQLALAEAGLRILQKTEEIKNYN